MTMDKAHSILDLDAMSGNAWEAHILFNGTRGVQSDPEIAELQIGNRGRRGNADCDFQPCRRRARTRVKR